MGARVQTGSPGNAFGDWEAEKQRILAALEAAAHEDDPHRAQEHLEIEELARKTNQLVAQKDREIAELRQLLEAQSARQGEMALGAAAIGQMLESDAVIREERENLKRLQEEWREKLRQAEVEISLERAKLARQRQELEERARSLAGQDKPAAEKGPPAESRGGTAGRRWLAKLGIVDEGQKK